MRTPAAKTVSLAIRGPISRDDLSGLSECVCALMSESDASVLLCDVQGVEPDAVTVDALCRLQVAARRRRCRVHLENASKELLDLVAFMGLTEVLPA